MKNAASLAAPSYRAKGAFAGLAAALLMLSAGGARAQDAAPPEAAPAAESQAAPIAVGANLNISPKRLTFDRSGKSATVYIFNQGATAATFDIGLIDRVMLPTGEIVPAADAATKPDQREVAERLKSANTMLLATPRRTTLEPGKGQTIRIRVNPGLESTVGAGEYRTHLTITTIPPRDIGLTAEQAAGTSPDELKFTVFSVFGISIPVIVRLGATDFRAAIDNVSLTYADISPDGVAPAVRTPVLNLDLVRQGANSLFGSIVVDGAHSKGKTPIGGARGVGVYTEIDHRAVHIPLTRAPEPGEQLQITFSDDDTSPGHVLAQSAFTSP